MATVEAIRQKCYTDYIYAYSVDDMAETSRMFVGSVDAIQTTLECFIMRGTIKAKIDATTSAPTFVQGDERHVAYAADVGAAEQAVALSQEIVLR